MTKESSDKTALSRPRWQMVLHEVIFEADTPAGKAFDVLLIVSILASVAAVMLDSIGAVRIRYGTLLYVIEGGQSGFTSIPRSIYWAVVTLTTVGYGDISPQTVLGQTLASLIMILGYAIIAVSTGIVTVQMTRTFGSQVSTQACPECSAEGHDTDAQHCKYCGANL